MTKLHRRDLKHDEIREKMTEAVKSVTLHGREVVYIAVIVVAVGVIAALWSFYEKQQQQQSQNLLAIAIDKYNSPVEAEGKPSDGSTAGVSYHYTTEADKYKDALKEFETVIEKYGNTPAAPMARYHAGICAFYLKDFAKSEMYLKQSASVSDRSLLFYQSRIALANLYNLTGKPDQAAQVLKEASDKNKNLVPPEYLLMEMAESYQKAGKKREASETYQKVLDEYKDSPISYQAQVRLNELKKNEQGK